MLINYCDGVEGHLQKYETTYDKELEKGPFDNPTESDIEEPNIELNLLDEDEDDEFVSVD